MTTHTTVVTIPEPATPVVGEPAHVGTSLQDETIVVSQTARDPGLDWLNPEIDPQRFAGQHISLVGLEHARREGREQFEQHCALLEAQGFNVEGPLDVADLVRAGYVLQNRIGQGERAIIQEVGERDYKGKLLLTREEVEYALPFMIPDDVRQGDISLSDLAQRMLEFVSASLQMKSLREMASEGGSWRSPIMAATGWSTAAHHNRLAQEFSRQNVQFKRLSPGEIGGIEESLVSELQGKLQQIPATLKGIEVSNFESRPDGKGVIGARSPILTETDDAKLHMQAEIGGMKIFPRNAQKQLRISSITAYLASRGICNTGEPQDWDQRYISSQGFCNLYRHADVVPDNQVLTTLREETSVGVKQKLFEKLAEKMQPNFEYQHKAPWWQRFNPFSPKEPPEQVTLSGEDVRIIGDYQFLLGLGEVDRNAADCIRNAQDMKERLDLLKRARAANPTLVDT